MRIQVRTDLGLNSTVHNGSTSRYPSHSTTHREPIRCQTMGKHNPHEAHGRALSHHQVSASPELIELNHSALFLELNSQISLTD